MEEENAAILLAIIIGAVILGIGLAMFFIRPYTGFGAVVLAIGLMTLSLILTMRAEEIIHLKVYPTAARSKTIADVSVETPSQTESTPQPSAETQTQEVLESREPYEDQVEQAPEVLEVEEAQQIQEVEETEHPYTPSMYESAPSQEEETTTAQEPQEASFEEREQEQERKPEPEPSIEVAPPDSEQSQETEEAQESTTTVVTTN